MSAKPSDVATWTGTPIAPDAGKRLAGFVSAEKPPAQYFNYLFGLAGQWQTWLNDGDCAFHNLSATGTLAVAGSTTLGDNAADACDIQGLVRLLNGGLQAFQGVNVKGGTLTVDTGLSVDIQGTSTLAVGGIGTFTAGVATTFGGVQVGNNQHVVVSGTGRYKHDTFKYPISYASFQQNIPSITNTISLSQNTARFDGPIGTTIVAPVNIQVGKRIKAIRVRVVDSVVGPTKLQAQLGGRDNSNTLITFAGGGASAVSAGSGNVQILTITLSTPYTVLDGDSIGLRVSTSVGTAGVDVCGAVVDADDF